MGIFKKLLRRSDQAEKTIRELQEKLRKSNELLIKQSFEIEALKTYNKQLLEELEFERQKAREATETLSKVLLENPQINRTIRYTLELMRRQDETYFKNIEGAEADLIVFHHDDIDGLICGALLEREFGREYSNTKIFYIPQKRRDLILKVKPRAKLISADLTLSEGLAKHLLELKEKGVDVKFFDHHPDSLKVGKSLLSILEEEGVFIWKDAPSATSVVCDYLGLNDEFSFKLREIADVCDSPSFRNKKPLDLVTRREISTLDNLLILDNQTISKARREVAKFGKVRSKELMEKAELARMLTAFTSRVMEKRKAVDTKYFQIYHLKGGDLLLRGIRKAARLIAVKEGKDVYVNLEENGYFKLIGRSKVIEVSNVFSRAAQEINAEENYGRGGVGGIIFEASKKKLNKVIKLLEEAYERKALLSGILSLKTNFDDFYRRATKSTKSPRFNSA